MNHFRLFMFLTTFEERKCEKSHNVGVVCEKRLCKTINRNKQEIVKKHTQYDKYLFKQDTLDNHKVEKDAINSIPKVYLVLQKSYVKRKLKRFLAHII